MENSMQALLASMNAAGIWFCFFGSFALAVALTKTLQRVVDSLDEFEQDIAALRAGNTPGSYQSLGQRVKITPKIRQYVVSCWVGIAFVALGSLFQLLNAAFGA